MTINYEEAFKELVQAMDCALDCVDCEKFLPEMYKYCQKNNGKGQVETCLEVIESYYKNKK